MPALDGRFADAELGKACWSAMPEPKDANFYEPPEGIESTEPSAETAVQQVDPSIARRIAQPLLLSMRDRGME